MPHATYIIVGGGMTADAAVRGIREVDNGGSILMFSAEKDPPYDRPPLSKGLWQGEREETVFCGTRSLNADILLGRRVAGLDVRAKMVTDDRGESYTFDRLLLATGGVPRRLPFGDDRIIYFRTLADYRRLQALVDRLDRFAVIGGGFIGSEIAAALAMSGKKVTIVFPDEGIGSRIYPRSAALFLNDFCRQHGIDVRCGHRVTGAEQHGVEERIMLADAKTGQASEVVADAVVAGIGIVPETALAQAAGLAVDNGIVVDELLRTSNPDIFAAGDVANFPSAALGQRMRVEHQDNAAAQGRAAGRAMAGQPRAYTHLPFFYSDLFEVGYEAVGQVDSRLEMVEDWQEPFQKGVIYYLQGGRVRGVLLWNVWERVDAARQLIGEPGPFDAGSLKGRLA